MLPGDELTHTYLQHRPLDIGLELLWDLAPHIHRSLPCYGQAEILGAGICRLPGFALRSLVDAGNKPNPDPAQGALPEQLFRIGGVRRNSFEARTEWPNGKLGEAFRCASSMQLLYQDGQTREPRQEVAGVPGAGRVPHGCLAVCLLPSPGIWNLNRKWVLSYAWYFWSRTRIYNPKHAGFGHQNEVT